MTRAPPAPATTDLLVRSARSNGVAHFRQRRLDQQLAGPYGRLPFCPMRRLAEGVTEVALIWSTLAGSSATARKINAVASSFIQLRRDPLAGRTGSSRDADGLVDPFVIGGEELDDLRGAQHRINRQMRRRCSVRVHEPAK
jgi:hypothetical protein